MFWNYLKIGGIFMLGTWNEAQAQHTLQSVNQSSLQRDTCPNYSPAALDSAYIHQIEQSPGKTKVLHAEPLFIDLIRDLGARKGEREWNFGTALVDNYGYDRYDGLVEYEFAPLDRLGLEVEVPFEFYTRHPGHAADTARPQNRVKSLKLAGQYTFFVSDRWNTSLALGYIHELEWGSWELARIGQPFSGSVFNPFFVGAKRWGANLHTLVYAGPKWIQHLNTPGGNTTPEMQQAINLNVHYMIPGTRNFVGLESNYQSGTNQSSWVLRPQMRVGIADDLLIGIVAGIPIDRTAERLSFFTRLIWEPGHKHR